MKSLKLNSSSPEQTRLLGSYLGELARQGDVFLLTGELGTGKTCLVQGIAQGLGVTEHAFSPSFVLIREYRGSLPLYHIDFYRLKHIEEIIDLGLEEYLYGDGVCAVEWAEKGTPALPEENLAIALDYTAGSETERSIVIEPKGERYASLVKKLELRLRGEKSWNLL